MSSLPPFLENLLTLDGTAKKLCIPKTISNVVDEEPVYETLGDLSPRSPGSSKPPTVRRRLVVVPKKTQTQVVAKPIVQPNVPLKKTQPQMVAPSKKRKLEENKGEEVVIIKKEFVIVKQVPPPQDPRRKRQELEAKKNETTTTLRNLLAALQGINNEILSAVEDVPPLEGNENPYIEALNKGTFY